MSMTFYKGVYERRGQGQVERREHWTIVERYCEGLYDVMRVGENFFLFFLLK
jgi:hypothetical protein